MTNPFAFHTSCTKPIESLKKHIEGVQRKSSQRRDTLEGILAQQQRKREVPPIRRERSWLERTFSKEKMRDNLRSHLNNPVDRFIRENPLSLMGPGGSLVAQGAKAVGTLAVQKVAPKLLAIGALSGTVNLMSKGGGKDSKDTGSSGKERVTSTKQDADTYLKGLQDQKGVLSDKMRTKDGYDYFEFKRRCEYKGIEFKKGDYISRDPLHHEWEWFRGKDIHKGAVNSITGNLDKIGNSGRRLRIK